MAEGRSIYEMIQTTEPGRYAVLIGEVLYDCTNAIEGSNSRKGRQYVIDLQALRAALEKQALDELAQRYPWVKELVARLAAPPPGGQEEN